MSNTSTTIYDFVSTDKDPSIETLSNGYVLTVYGQLPDTRYGGLTGKSIKVFFEDLEDLLDALRTVLEAPNDEDVDPTDYE